jgi:hypothetical protein
MFIREDELRGRRRDGFPEVEDQLAVDRDRLDAPPLRDVAVVRSADEDVPRVEVDVRLLEREKLSIRASGFWVW